MREQIFPGMNPYLEDAYYWHSFHTELIACLHQQLSEILPAGYRSSMEQRLTIGPAEETRQAELSVTYVRQPAAAYVTGNDNRERGAPTCIVGAVAEEEYEWYVEIKTVGKERKVVGIIEVLSPSNKAAGSAGWREYKRKQRELLCSDTHMMEIDLLRGGLHTVAAPLAGLSPKSEWDYIVSLYRAPDRHRFPVWLNRLDEKLPEVLIPLLTGDSDVVLDLQKSFDLAFKTGRYTEDIEMSKPLPV